MVEGAVLLHQDDDVFNILDGASDVVGGDGQRAADAGRERGQRGGGAPAAAARGHAQGVVIACGAEYRIERLRASTELGQIGLAQGNRPRRALAADDQAVALGHEVAVQRRTVSRAQAGRQE
ncbi:hypothetical protein G6F40_015393 [Rhizopus arrhizus]|nr:hypothetical protein G6F40_015393 [Rhizopus arrhizus]